MDYRNEALRLVEEHVVDRNLLLIAWLEYKSQDEVKDMLHCNEIQVLGSEETSCTSS